MLDTQKITAHVPKQLLKAAQEATGKGITETVKEGLEALARASAADELLALQGKVKFSINLDELREDKEYR